MLAAMLKLLTAQTRYKLLSADLVRRPLALKLSTSAAMLVNESDHCPDYYAVLGITKTATPVQVKVAYFKQAKKFHPDQNRSEEARLMFELVAEAYEVLSDERKRKNFDEFGTPGVRFGGTTAGAGGPGRARGPENYDPEELYDRIFGEASRGGGQEDVPQMEYEDYARSYSGTDSTKEFRISTTFDQAARGADFDVDLTVKAICWKCSGSGSAPGYTWNVCPYCEGTGFETEKVGHMLSRHPCAMCNGTKRFIKYKCDKCEGHGSFITFVTQTITIPPGSENGQVFRYEVDEKVLDGCVRDQQEKFFYVYLTVEKSLHFTRDELNLHSERDVSLSQALLGGQIHVRGLHRKDLWVELPPLFDPAQSLLIPNEGIIRSGGMERGHHFVKVALKVPARVEGRERDLMLSYARLEVGREGTVNGLEDQDSHRYNVSVVKPKSVTRSFNVINGVAERPDERVEQFSRLSRAKENAKKENGHHSVLSKLWNRLRQ